MSNRKNKKTWWVGLGVGVLLTVVMILASGFMIETTNKDTFCASCHVMEPFRTSWQEASPSGYSHECAGLCSLARVLPGLPSLP
jgi:cytochrome c-type protein NapC